MSKLTKRQKEIQSRVDNEKQYTLEEAVQILNDLPALKFKESI
ncbi:MAG: 50S ribosomal protein L1, partial [Psychrobacter sp.]